MTKRAKLRKKLRNNPVDANMQDLQTLLEGYDFVLDRVSGSHHLFIYETATAYRSISVPLHGKKVKKVYTQKALDLLDELFPESTEEDDHENA